jgi:fermentation-respiration switch protein FrsA (DUF1100 family)
MGLKRRDVSFQSRGLKCAGWYYVPADLDPGETRPAIVMAHGYSGVKEMYLDKFAERFAAAGLVVLVFDYRFFGASEGQPRGQLFYFEQHQDYRNAITWVSLQPEVDPDRIGLWGTSFSGAHVLHLAAFDKRVKAVVAQVPGTNSWETYFERLKPEALAQRAQWLAQRRREEYSSGTVNYLPVVAPAGKPCVLAQKESYQWFTRTAKLRAPNWRNQVTVESVDVNAEYAPVAYIHLISPAPMLMIVASDDIVTPTAEQRQAFTRAGPPKKLVVVQGRHFDAYQGSAFTKFATPAVKWFLQHLRA